MINLILSVVLLIAAAIIWKWKIFSKSKSVYSVYATVGAILLVLVSIYFISSTSFVVIDADKTGHLNKVLGVKSLPEGKIIAANGERGKQARIIPPGLHIELMVNVLYRIEEKKDIDIPGGRCGKITALDGEPLPEGEIYAPEWPEDKSGEMIGAEYFLKNGGKKGPQITVLKPGRYKINQYLFNVDPSEEVTTVEQGFVGVVKSNAQQVPYVQEEVDKLNVRTTGDLISLIVPKGYKGVWKDVLWPGQYYLNKDVFEVIPFDSRVQTWEYAGDITRRYVDLQVDQSGSIKQTERQEEIPSPKGAADRAIVVRIEGWEIPIDSRILVQVAPENAPYVVATVGNMDEVENDILTPTYRSIVRNVCGREGRKALDLLSRRTEIEELIEAEMIPEGNKAFISIKEIRLGEPAYPPELMLARIRQQLAEQLKAAFIQEKMAQDERIKTEKAREEANQQTTLIAAQIRKQAAEFERESSRLQGEGEKLRLQEIAKGQQAQSEVLGKDIVLQLAMLKEILDAAKQNPQIVKVPNILVQGTAGGFEGAAAILGASNLTSGLRQVPEKTRPPDETKQQE